MVGGQGAAHRARLNHQKADVVADDVVQFLGYPD
ncbi:MAG: hypothetical protein QOI83_1923, partial [Streptomycetaceae bacterium]|nr:hypothetical protein [Streptomycetaceae bacterium]